MSHSARQSAYTGSFEDLNCARSNDFSWRVDLLLTYSSIVP